MRRPCNLWENLRIAIQTIKMEQEGCTHYRLCLPVGILHILKHGFIEDRKELFQPEAAEVAPQSSSPTLVVR